MSGLSTPKESAGEVTITKSSGPWSFTFRRATVLLGAFFAAWFYYIHHIGYRKGLINDLSNLYLAIPLMGGLYGLNQLSKVRGPDSSKRSSMFQALVRIVRCCKEDGIYGTYRLALWLFCCGLVFWAIGCAVGIYYNVIHGVKTPYAFIGDGFFALCFIFWSAGIICLYERGGKNVINEANTTLAILVPLWSALVTISYLIQGGDVRLYISRTGLLAFILDMFFPLIDLFNLGLLITLLPGPGNEKIPIRGKPLRLIVLGYFFLCLASSSFTICHSLPEDNPYAYHSGGFTDVMFATAFTILNFGIFYSTKIEMKSEPLSRT
jgi:hypothetical protein